MPHNGKNGRIYTADGAGGERVLSTPNSEDRLGGGGAQQLHKTKQVPPLQPGPPGQWKQTFSGREGPKQTLSSQTSRCRGARRQEGWRTGRVRRGPSCPHRTGESRQVSLARVLSCEATGRPARGGDM